MRSPCLISTILAVSALSGGCKESTGKRAPEPGVLVAAAGETLSSYAGTLRAALASCDGAALAELCDQEQIARMVARSSESSSASALYELTRTRTDFATEFLCIGEAPTYIGTRLRGGLNVLSFRVDEDAGPHYYEFLVAAKDEQGSPRCVDRQDLSTGWTLQELLSTSSDLEAKVLAYSKLQGTMGTNPDAVVAAAKEYEKSAPLQALAVAASAHLGAERYQAALEAFRENFSGDLSVYVQSMASLADAGAFSLASEAAEALGKAIGDEEGLLTTRVEFLLEAKDYELATSLAELSLEANPTSKEAHYRLLEVLVESRNFSGAVAVMRLLGERFNVRFSEDGMDTSHPAYAELIASDAWAAY